MGKLFAQCIFCVLLIPVRGWVVQSDWNQLSSDRINYSKRGPQSALHAQLKPPSYEELQSQCLDFQDNVQQEQEELLRRDGKIYLIPIVVAILQFNLFPQTSQVFHSALEALSLSQYTGELSKEIRPLINGPVTLTVSILFGSLVSMTISTLYQRQTELHRTGIATANTARHLQFLAEGLPEPERSRVKEQVKIYSLRRLRGFFNGSLFDKENRSFDLNPILLTLHKLGERTDSNGVVLGELYAAISNLKEINIQFTAAVQKNFTPAHYGNLLAQAFTLLLIYLWETDDAALLEAHTFELRAAWSMLMGTMASLVAIIIDLNTPTSNIITMVRKYEVDMDEMISFTLAKDLNDAKALNGAAGMTVENKIKDVTKATVE